MPIVEVRGGVVSIRYTQVASCDWTGYRPERPAEVALNAGIPWDVEVRGGASRLLADLSGLRLGSLSVDGGASRLEVVLPDPSGAVTVVILGAPATSPSAARKGCLHGSAWKAANWTSEAGATRTPWTATTSPLRAARTT
jgi:hypothetical protein